MIIKPHTYPRILKQLEALKRRIPPDHPKVSSITQSLAMRSAGYKGELNMQHPLSFINDSLYQVFYDVRLEDRGNYFQMDVLLVSRNFIAILEVKNIAGTLYFDTDFNQLIRIQNGLKEAFPDPLTQITRQQAQFSNWLKSRDYFGIPVKSFVVISNPRTLLQALPDNTIPHSKVIHSSFIPSKITDLETLYTKPYLTENKMVNLTREILNSHRENHVNILELNQISKAEIIPGIHCPECFLLPIDRVYGNRWKCHNCGVISNNAYIHSLSDYSLLISQSVTNKDARYFLKIDSRSIVSKMLNSMSIERIGNNKSSLYRL
ncbi:nuclease-related domain-containing protein [Metabacillus sp. 113a]|uniref:nuclease-related domain-containing protein n=1 Tax=Metabacillus sp. 113a TaxID=3404706 RepID=UPI003CEF8DF8